MEALSFGLPRSEIAALKKLAAKKKTTVGAILRRKLAA
jgi:hypothetical protein